MTFGIARGAAVDAAGNLQDHVWVEVRRMVPGFPMAVPIYADSAGDTALDNPFMSDTGEFEFYAVGGTYRVHVYKTGWEKTWDDVPVGTAQGSDVDAYASAGFTWAPESATGTPPSTGCIRFDNADVSLAGHIYVSKDTLGNSDVTSWLESLVANDWVLLSTGVGLETGWPIIGVTNNTDWFDIQVTTASYSGPTGPVSFGDSGFVTMAFQKAALSTAGNTVVKTTSGDVTIGNTDGVLILNKGTPEATGVTLPAASGRNGLSLHVADFGGNAGDITFTPHAGDTIMGQSSWIIGSGGFITLRPSTSPAGWYL